MSDHSWIPRRISAADVEPLHPPAIGGLIYRELVHLFSGEPESLKGWLVLVLALEEIRTGGVVLYVDFEMGERQMADRLLALGATEDDLERFLYVEPAEPLTDKRIATDVARIVIEECPTLVVIDSSIGSMTLHGLDPYKPGDVERHNTLVISPLRAHGAAVVVLDHVVKNRDARGKFATGSERKLGSVDVHLGLEVKEPFGRGRRGVAKLRTHKDRPGFLPRPTTGELELQSDADTGRITWDIRLAEQEQGERVPTSFRPTHLMQRVSIYLEQQSAAMSRRAIARDVVGKRDYVLCAIDCLIDDGFAAEQDGPRGARLVSSISPYREDDRSPFPDRSPAFPGNGTPTVPPFPPSRDGERGTVDDGVSEVVGLLEETAS